MGFKTEIENMNVYIRNHAKHLSKLEEELKNSFLAFERLSEKVEQHETQLKSIAQELEDIIHNIELIRAAKK